MKKSLKYIIPLLFSATINAECKIDYSVIYTLADNERHLQRDVGYPYLISFNDKADAKKAKSNLSLNWLDGRTVDCKNSENCKIVLGKLNTLNMTNLDLGAFQINQNSFSYDDKSVYFNLEQSYEKACAIVYSHYKETNNWSWETIARYHSKTPSINKVYAKGLKKRYAKLIKTSKKEKTNEN